MRHKLIPIVAVLFILAAAVAFYPPVSNALAERNRSLVRTEYIEQIEQTDDAELAAILVTAREYNASLSGAFDPNRGVDDYYDQLTVGDSGIMGYIEIPKIDVYLPIYHGTDADTLDAGVGHLVGSSLPVGGTGTHTALSAHSGLAREKMFSDLDQLAIGDVFYLHILDQTLAYEVDEIHTVLPEDTSLLIIGLVIALFPVGNGFVTEHQMAQQAEAFIRKAEMLPAFTEAVQSTNSLRGKTPDFPTSRSATRISRHFPPWRENTMWTSP